MNAKPIIVFYYPIGHLETEQIKQELSETWHSIVKATGHEYYVLVVPTMKKNPKIKVFSCENCDEIDSQGISDMVGNALDALQNK